MFPNAEVEPRGTGDMPALLVRIGSTCCALRCSDVKVLNVLRGLYDGFLSEEPPDVTLDLEIVERMSPAQLEAVRERIMIDHQGDAFRDAEDVIAGDHTPDLRQVRLEVERTLLESGVASHFINYAASAVYYTACKVKYAGDPPAFIVHCSAILRDGRAFLFTGPGGAGKTTIARMCRNGHGVVLNDEAILVTRSRSDCALSVQGIPIVGELPQRASISAPLSCVLFIVQSTRTAVRRLDRMEAYVSFMRQIVTPAHIGQIGRRDLYSQIAEFSDETTSRVPFFELEFTLDEKPLWEVVGEVEESLKGGIEHE